MARATRAPPSRVPVFIAAAARFLVACAWHWDPGLETDQTVSCGAWMQGHRCCLPDCSSRREMRRVTHRRRALRGARARRNRSPRLRLRCPCSVGNWCHEFASFQLLKCQGTPAMSANISGWRAITFVVMSRLENLPFIHTLLLLTRIWIQWVPYHSDHELSKFGLIPDCTQYLMVVAP